MVYRGCRLMGGSCLMDGRQGVWIRPEGRGGMWIVVDGRGDIRIGVDGRGGGGMRLDSRVEIAVANRGGIWI